MRIEKIAPSGDWWALWGIVLDIETMTPVALIPWMIRESLDWATRRSDEDAPNK